MNIENIINELFKNIPYSKKQNQIRNKIKRSLEEEYNKNKEKLTHLENITTILKNMEH